MKKIILFGICFMAWCANAQIVNIPDPELKTVFVNSGADTNGDGEIQVSEAEAVTTLIFGFSGNDLTGLEAFVNLEVLYCTNNPNLTTLDLTGFPHLREAGGGKNPQLTTVNVTGLAQLEYYEFVLSGITNIIGISSLTNVRYMDISENPLTSIDLTGLSSLRRFISLNVPLASITFPVPNQMIEVFLINNAFTTLDLTPLHYVEPINPNENNWLEIQGCQNLQYVNIKNGSYRMPVNYDSCPNLHYVCADEDEIADYAETFAESGIQMNSYCSFVPGGNFNTIAGNITFDGDNNGCDAADLPKTGLPVSISDGTSSSYTFTQDNGEYDFYTSSGSYTITPVLPGEYFTITPQAATIDFAGLLNQTQPQNFCVTANGIHPDLEVTLTPLRPARPGFDSLYKIAYKNNGNQTLSGTVSLQFDDAVFDLVTASPVAPGQSENLLSWEFSDLQPFEIRSINITLNLNSPVETPAVNIGDILAFEAAVTPVDGDETPQDNVLAFGQIAVGSYDPNDKTCVEGSNMTPEMVGDYLHYVIRFQNSGTFYAENVVVKDNIDTEKFDISTLQLTASSHPQVTRITGNKAEFIFEGINLPAEQDDEPGSHGFVAFKIKTKQNLSLNSVVENTADIFFDFNAPIVTNTTSTMVTELGIGEFEDTSVSIAPNPVKNILDISAKDKISSIRVFDIQGRLLHTKLESDTFATLDFSGKTNGVYFVKVQTEKGMKVRKIIKE